MEYDPVSDEGPDVRRWNFTRFVHAQVSLSSTFRPLKRHFYRLDGVVVIRFSLCSSTENRNEHRIKFRPRSSLGVFVFSHPLLSQTSCSRNCFPFLLEIAKIEFVFLIF